MRYLSCLIIISLLFACTSKKSTEDQAENLTTKDSVFTTPLGKTYLIPEPSEKLLAQYQEAKGNFEANPEDVGAIV